MKNTKTKTYTDEASPRNLKDIEKPALSVQVIIFSVNKHKLEIILIKRVREPFKDFWSIPGDIISIKESLEDAARKILFEKTGIHNVYLEQLYTFGEINRDPRGRVIAITYFALLPHNSVDLSKAPNALHAKWTPITNLPILAFDHKTIIDVAIKKIKIELLNSNLATALLPKEFRLYDLQKIHEIVLNKHIDKRNFRKKIQSLGLIEPTGNMYKDGNHRPAQLFRFKNE